MHTDNIVEFVQFLRNVLHVGVAMRNDHVDFALVNVFGQRSCIERHARVRVLELRPNVQLSAIEVLGTIHTLAAEVVYSCLDMQFIFVGKHGQVAVGCLARALHKMEQLCCCCHNDQGIQRF